MINIVIRSYNSAGCIHKALQSATNQSLDKALIEITVVDDGSSDNTLSVVSKFDQVKILEKAHTGPVKTINFAIEKCTTKYIIFLDADDCLELFALEYLWLARNDADFIYSNYWEVKNGKKELVVINSLSDMIGCGILYKTEDLLTMGLFNESMVFSEYDMFSRMLKKGLTCKKIDVPLYYYYRDQNSLTSDKNLVELGKKQVLQKNGICIRNYEK